MVQPRVFFNLPRADARKRVARGDVVPIVRLETMDDAALVAAVLSGVGRAPMVLFDRHATRIERSLARLVGPSVETAPLLNDVFCRALDRLTTLNDPSGLRPWLDKIAVYVARESLRARRRRAWLEFRPEDELPDEAWVGSPEGEFDSRRAVQRLHKLLGGLAADDHLLFALRHLEQRELEDIAALREMSLASVKRHLGRVESRVCAMAQRDPLLRGWMEGGGAP